MTPEEEFERFVRGSLKFVGVLILAGIIVFGFGFGFFLVGVPAGSVGVQDTFGSVDSAVLDPGLHLKSPFTSIVPMSVKTQKYMDYGTSDKATISALSHDGLTTTMGVAINYHLNPDKATEVYKNIGVNYPDVIMVNPIHSVPRDLISKYDTKTLYSASQEGSMDRQMLEQELFTGITNRLNQIGVKGSITIEQVSIRDIDFPQTYKDAITSKMKMDTEIQQKALEVQVQEMEAHRVVAQAQGEAQANIERAKGEAEANRIRTASLTPALLKYTWIQSMKDNPHAIYIATGEDGMPFALTKMVEDNLTAI